MKIYYHDTRLKSIECTSWKSKLILYKIDISTLYLRFALIIDYISNENKFSPNQRLVFQIFTLVYSLLFWNDSVRER